ncbi:cytochrome c oxidase-assembly factor mitochondrial [Sporothrix brasiliensis 5110]|uniref:Cytochrome c oxidase assembly protein COX16, mitochondrial n=1 Tax=Sporothrix brasiliensis 5110 TaxID=1398154 RepID=A0A0C2F6R9_9PEZI|nr:cytochrome c oxidase-assembly factor mitochondrial [Sporothrix brasiliensis 5110]KIH94624.1 cytochrome c oxidase-assembly factor mitochondrial [Sporothrix brasiliensis 5110]
MAFQKNRYRSAADANTFAARYRAHMAKHPFLLFGLPFMAVIIGGSFVLTTATAIRYERHDRKVRMVSREDELGIGKSGRRVNMREEYNRLAHKDLDNWEQKRVERLKGESDGVL